MSEMQIRLRCVKCSHEFVRPESIIEGNATKYMRDKQCPQCRCDAVTLAALQPRPPVWWSDSVGLIARIPRGSGDAEVRYKVLDGAIGSRAMTELPFDAVPMAPQPGTDEQRVARQRAADRVSAFLDEREKTDDGSQRNEIYRLNDHRLTMDDLRLLVQAAPTLPPKWSGLTADPYIYFVQETGNDRTDALIHAREVLNVLEAQGPDADVCRDGLVGLSAHDLKTLCDLDGGVVFVGFDRARAEALADGERTALMWTRVHR